MAKVMATVAERPGFEPGDPCESAVFKLEAGPFGPCGEYNGVVQSRPQSDGKSDGTALWFEARRAARLLGMPTEDVIRLCKAGQLVGVKGPKFWLVEPASLRAAMATRNAGVPEAPTLDSEALAAALEEIDYLRAENDRLRFAAARRTRRPLRQRFEILKRDGYRCRYCGRSGRLVQLEVDHVVAVAEGGTDDDDNLVTACGDCNQGKSSRPAPPPP